MAEGGSHRRVLRYINSWVTTDLVRCYQVMECDDRRLLDQWLDERSDLVDFDVHPVITSAEAATRVLLADAPSSGLFHRVMLRTALGAIGAFFLWLAWELVGSAAGELFGWLLRPITRPLWQVIVRAGSPWPLALMLLVGMAAALGGVVLMPREKLSGTVGLFLFFADAALTLFAPLLWRDARAEATAREASRDVS